MINKGAKSTCLVRMILVHRTHQIGIQYLLGLSVRRDNLRGGNECDDCHQSVSSSDDEKGQREQHGSSPA
jgi:hypothetical protein